MSNADPTNFSNKVIADWEAAMDRFMEAVDRKKESENLNDAEVARALYIGYGHEVSEYWNNWVEGF